MTHDDLGRFGDARLEKVGAALLAAMRQSPTMCLHALAKDRNQTIQFGRFLDNDAVSAEEMLTRAGQLTGARVAGRHVLAIQDTTEVSFAAHAASKRGFGTAGNGRDLGLFLHPLLAVDAAHGGVIGLVGAQVLNRTAGLVADHKGRPADHKESRRWLAGAETAGEVLAEAAMITVVGDRESDIYDQFARRPDNVHLLTRAAQDRTLEGGARLFDEVAAWEVRSCDRIEVPPRGPRAARVATVALRFGEVVLRRPAAAARSLAATVRLRVVDVVETDPPEGEAAVHWCLLSTHAVGDVAQARAIVGWYRSRWTIEQVFRTLKTAGARIEDSQMIGVKAFVKLAVTALIAAVRIMQIVLARDGTTAQSLADAADPLDIPALEAINASLEGRTEKLRNPHPATTLAWLSWIVGRLGGWAGYASKGYKPAGPKTVHRGLIRLDGMISGWHLANHSAHVRLP